MSGSYSIIPYLFFFQSNRGITTGIIFIINVLYRCCRFIGKFKIPVGNWMFLLYCLLMVVNTIASILSNTGLYQSWLYLLSNGTFFLILYNCYMDYKRTQSDYSAFLYVIRGYIILCIICVISCVSLFVLIKIGIDPHVNNVSNQFDLFQDNVSNLGHTYYFPYYLSIILDPGNIVFKIPFFTDKGIICGIYYEPHILTFMLCPALFFMWSHSNRSLNNLTLLFLWILIMLLACSTTNILAFLLCCFIYLCIDKQKRWVLVPIGVLTLLLIFYIGLQNTEFFFILDKLDTTGDGGGSQRYTLRTMEFAFSPQTLLGSNFLNTDYLKYEGRDVGYIPFMLNILILFLLYINTLKLILHKNRYHQLMGVGVLYFLLHSMKVTMQTYSLSIFMLMIFILSTLNSIISTKNEKKRHLSVVQE